MRALVLGAALVLLGAAPQDKPSIPPLDQVIDANIWWSSDRALDISAMVAVCRHRAISCVIEVDHSGQLPLQEGRDGYWQETLQGLTVREALDVFVDTDPRYHWGELDGVIVVRPRVAWTDKRSRINQEFPALSLVDADLGGVLQTVKDAAHGYLPRADGRTSGSPPIGRTVTARFGGGTMLNALAAIARADGQLVWTLGFEPPHYGCPASMTIGFYAPPPVLSSYTCLKMTPQRGRAKRK